MCWRPALTATLAEALAGRGALDVGAPVEQLVPELAGTCFAGATVRDLRNRGRKWHAGSDV